ncbi:hypothetical protein EDB85DRAFT_2275855 [Lactarius pseudohatsudake]|nr:hypothetical protein EDB85DRAFT_2275855 [Lactarius pseudohatsudake]
MLPFPSLPSPFPWHHRHSRGTIAIPTAPLPFPSPPTALPSAAASSPAASWPWLRCMVVGPSSCCRHTIGGHRGSHRATAVGCIALALTQAAVVAVVWQWWQSGAQLDLEKKKESGGGRICGVGNAQKKVQCQLPTVLQSPLFSQAPVAVSALRHTNPSPPPPTHHHHLRPIITTSHLSQRLQPIAAASDPYTAQEPPRRYPHTVWNFHRYDTDDNQCGGGRRRPTRRGTMTTRRGTMTTQRGGDDDAEGDNNNAAGATVARATVLTRRGQHGGMVAVRRHS